jgi:hypothetical protein
MFDLKLIKLSIIKALEITIGLLANKN